MIQLMSLDATSLSALRQGAASVQGAVIQKGAMPPAVLFDLAAQALAAGKPLLWHAPWLIVSADGQWVVGAMGFKAPPQDGLVEIGYNVAPAWQGRGVASAAVRQLLALAAEQPALRMVRAETAADNAASRRVLEKNGFHLAGRHHTEADGWVDDWRYTLS